MQKSVAAALLCLPAVCSSQYIRLPIEGAIGTAKSEHGKVILSDRQENCSEGNRFALLIADAYLNYAGCWFYDTQQDAVYVRFAGDRQHKRYSASSFKQMRDSASSSVRVIGMGWELTTEQKQQMHEARQGKLIDD
jgi:hypothetical protein